MSLQGILIIDILGVGFIIMLINLVRIKKLYVSYAIIWLFSIILLMLIISVPPLLALLPGLVGAVYPASALSLLAFVLIFMILIFMSVKISILHTRQVELIQHLAMNALQAQDRQTAAPKDTGSS
jgi:hypothetical protein